MNKSECRLGLPGDGRSTDALSRRAALLRAGATLAVMGGAGASGWAANEGNANTYDEDSILKAATEFFGSTTEGLAKVIEKAFKEQGRPNAYIKGEEASAALTVGVRYGDGRLMMKNGGSARVYWSGPSIGLDVGANASKVFTLVYKLPNTAAIFQRFPGVEGSLYYIGGASINYQRSDGITLAPIRLGVGLRTGANIGYVHYRREKSYLPF